MAEDTEKKCEACGKSYSKESDYLHSTSQWRLCSEGNLWFNCSCGSTIMILKGKFSWYSPDRFLSQESKSVFNSLAGMKDFPHIPTVILEIQKKVLDDGVDAKTLANIVRSDPFLAAEVLRIASNLKDLRAIDRSKIRSLEHSITYLGRSSLSQMVVVASITSFKLKTTKFSIEEFMRRSLVCAVISEELGRRFNSALRQDEVYLSGCLANIGKVVSALCFPDQTDLIASKAGDRALGKSWQELEQEYQNIDHCILGEIGASVWGLPKFVGEVCRTHHLPPPNTPIAKGQATLNQIVSFANLLTPCFVNSQVQPDEIKILAMAKSLSLAEEDLDELLKDLGTRVA